MNACIIKTLGSAPYLETWQLMKTFTERRDAHVADELWLLQHPAVYTQGQAGKPEHVLNSHQIPIVQTDRGGQVTYHGPGQMIGYCLTDLKRLGIGVRSLVRRLEQSVIDLLALYGIESTARCDAPGVYVEDAKICSIGLRVKRGCSYHGIALNIDMDLTPFYGINPCGYAGLKMVQIKDFVPSITVQQVMDDYQRIYKQTLGYAQ